MPKQPKLPSEEHADDVIEAVQEMFLAIPKTKQVLFLGHLNDILLFLEATKAVISK